MEADMAPATREATPVITTLVTDTDPATAEGAATDMTLVMAPPARGDTAPGMVPTIKAAAGATSAFLDSISILAGMVAATNKES